MSFPHSPESNSVWYYFFMRVLILSDIHANLVALETVLAATEGSYDTIWCLGDVVGYGPRPNECVEIIRERAELCVMGNHDWAVLGRPGIDVDEFNPHARQAVLWTRDELTDDSRQYLEELPDVPIHPEQTDDILITHASPREPVWEYIVNPRVAMDNFGAFDEPICFVGHTHKPAIFRWRILQPAGSATSQDPPISGPPTVDYLQQRSGVDVSIAVEDGQRLIINPGSVGQPRDNDARSAFAILDLDKMVWRYERVAYPVELTQGQMQEAKLPRRLIDRLSFGW
jgi:predicted phosphodiesterase